MKIAGVQIDMHVPGKHEIHRLADRRPALYAPLVGLHDLMLPGRDSQELAE